jgi:hypothetical protein
MKNLLPMTLLKNKNAGNVLIATFAVILIVYGIYSISGFRNVVEGMEPQCPDQSTSEEQIAALGETAREACNRISSRAEEIEAHYNGAKGVVDSILGPLSPNNYKAGDNSSNDMVRNIVNTNLSSCDITKISNDCKNTSTSVQVNEIDTTKCKYCENNLCTLKNITQRNIAEASQTCTIQSTIETLLKKKSSVDAQALAQVLQKAQNPMSGDNASSTENCNVLNADMSSVSYMEQRSECANNLAIDQENSLKACGSVIDVIQENQFKSLQNCLMGTDITKTEETESDTKIKSEKEVDQRTTGIDLSSITTSWMFVIGAVVLLSIASSGFSAWKSQDIASAASAAAGASGPGGAGAGGIMSWLA